MRLEDQENELSCGYDQLRLLPLTLVSQISAKVISPRKLDVRLHATAQPPILWLYTSTIAIRSSGIIEESHSAFSAPLLRDRHFRSQEKINKEANRGQNLDKKFCENQKLSSSFMVNSYSLFY